MGRQDIIVPMENQESNNELNIKELKKDLEFVKTVSGEVI